MADLISSTRCFVTNRRAFVLTVAGSLLAARLDVLAQQAPGVSRIGYLRRTSREARDIEALQAGLRELGYVERHNLVIEERYANGDAARLPDLARDLIKLKVQVLVVDGGATVRAVRDVIGGTPLVFTLVGDPVAMGVARSLDHPGGTMTGLSTFNTVISAKRIQLLHEVAPATRVGVLSNPTGALSPAQVERMTGTARSLGIELIWTDAQSPGELAGAFTKLTQAGAKALLVETDAMFFSQRARIVDLAAKHRLPAVYGEREFADVGGLMAYATNLPATFRHAATYVDKILKGARPGDLPIEQPTRIELVLNLKSARALGLTIPPSVLLRADDFVE
jgi:putative ABC transport system substrate-binding protein